METKANISFHTRAFAQVISPALYLLGCLYRALGYLSGMLFRVLVRMEALVTLLFGFLGRMTEELLQVMERKAVKYFTRRGVHNRKHALFTGNAKKICNGDNTDRASGLFQWGRLPKRQKRN